MSNINYDNRVVAFIDILGFKEIISESETDLKKLGIIYEALNFLKSKEGGHSWDLKLVEIEEDAQKKGVHNFDISENTSCTCFSDSIVVSVKVINNNYNEVISTLVTHLSFIGAKLMTEGILFRGAITFGKLIHQESGIILGRGMIEAYQLESSTAVFPRIIISKKLLEKLNYPLIQKRDRFPYHQYFQRFDDGCIGFHQMIYFQVIQSWTEMTKENLQIELLKIKNTIIKGLDSSMEDPRTFEKFNWLKKQYNDLVILTENVKEKIYDLNAGTYGPNVHYSNTDEFYYSRDESI